MSQVERNSVLSEDQILFENKYGFIIYRIDNESYCDIDFIRIDKNSFRSGKGTELLQEFIKFANDKFNVNEYYLDAVVQNPDIMNMDNLISFYKNNGFEIAERFTMDEVERATMVKEGSKNIIKKDIKQPLSNTKISLKK